MCVCVCLCLQNVHFNRPVGGMSGKSYFIFTFAFLFAFQLALFYLLLTHTHTHSSLFLAIFSVRDSSTRIYIDVHVRNIIVRFVLYPVSIESMLNLSDRAVMRAFYFFIALPTFSLDSFLIDSIFFSPCSYQWLLAMSHTIYSI